MLCVMMLSIVMLSSRHTECCSILCHGAECCHAVHHHVECSEYHYEEGCYAEGRYVECNYSWCCCGECHTLSIVLLSVSIVECKFC